MLVACRMEIQVTGFHDTPRVHGKAGRRRRRLFAVAKVKDPVVAKLRAGPVTKLGAGMLTLRSYRAGSVTRGHKTVGNPIHTISHSQETEVPFPTTIWRAPSVMTTQIACASRYRR